MASMLNSPRRSFLTLRLQGGARLKIQVCLFSSGVVVICLRFTGPVWWNAVLKLGAVIRPTALSQIWSLHCAGAIRSLPVYFTFKGRVKEKCHVSQFYVLNTQMWNVTNKCDWQLFFQPVICDMSPQKTRVSYSFIHSFIEYDDICRHVTRYMNHIVLLAIEQNTVEPQRKQCDLKYLFILFLIDFLSFPLCSRLHPG